ncbi:hypothetical protein GY12_10760 [Micrococcus luteus]|nr:hypothetical protein GY12_10760 [Micrococcus luteus]
MTISITRAPAGSTPSAACTTASTASQRSAPASSTSAAATTRTATGRPRPGTGAGTAVASAPDDSDGATGSGRRDCAMGPLLRDGGGDGRVPHGTPGGAWATSASASPSGRDVTKDSL